MVKRKGLGRGLDALLSAGEEDPEEGVTLSSLDTLKQIPIEFMTRGKYQPRRDMHPEALEDLASSIRVQGVMQPIVVRPVGVDSYEIIAGERRWRATQLAGLETIPAIVRDVPDESAIAMALIENIQREDLNAIEEAQALIRLQQEFELTQQQVADAVGKSRTTITNLMRLMSLEQEVQTLLEHGDLEMGHARALLGLEGRVQLDAARAAVAKGMTVRQTEALVRHLQQQQEQPGSTENHRMDPDIKRLQDKLSDQVGASVSIQHNAKGKGRLILKYNSLDELEGILDHIK
jgi:ParB family chromosome partitioning protein